MAKVINNMEKFVIKLYSDSTIYDPIYWTIEYSDLESLKSDFLQYIKKLMKIEIEVYRVSRDKSIKDYNKKCRKFTDLRAGAPKFYCFDGCDMIHLLSDLVRGYNQLINDPVGVDNLSINDLNLGFETLEEWFEKRNINPKTNNET